MKVLLLGTGTSQGIPIIGCECKVCTSSDPRDNRLRTSALVSIGDYNILIDAGPDFRQQMLRYNISKIDAILLTHEHNDHISGLDDIRPFNFKQGIDIPIYSLKRVLDDLRIKFAYIFVENPYPGSPRVVLHEVVGGDIFEIFPGISIQAIQVMHGTLPILGFRINSMAYITDASALSEIVIKQLGDLEILILNALRHRAHIAHFTLDEAQKMAKKINASTTYLTHMSHELGLHSEIEANTTENVKPGYDGLILEASDNYVPTL